nr:MAG TPA: YjcQ protein [Caudoviricetes sp.]
MKLDTKQQVLLAFYIEYQKDLPNMKNVNNTKLNLDITVFNVALAKLENEGYIKGLLMFSADNDEFYEVNVNNVKLTRDGIEYVENNFGINKELTAEDKLKYVIKKCGVLGLEALKMFGVEVIKTLTDIV